MFQLTKQSETTKLLQWNKELPSASAADPLGLNLRVSARLANELLHCITSITPRARYYSFFPWAFEDYNENERDNPKHRGRIDGVVVRERAMVLGAVLHHEGKPCEGGALGGSDPASNLVKSNKKSFDLSTWKHLRATEGQFGAAYKGSLINLGLFKTDRTDVEDEAGTDADELDEATQAIEVRELSSLGKRLADAFEKSVRRTSYITDKWSLKNVVSAGVLQEFGARAGLCEINEKAAADRATLRSMFLARDGFLNNGSHYRRRMSLLLLLECIGRTHAAGADFDNFSFSDICYFGELVVDEEKRKSVTVKLPQPLHDIAERWRTYHSHNYLAVALQSFLVAAVRILRDRPGGVTRAELFDGFSSSAINVRFKELFEHNLPGDFFEMTPRELMGICGIALPKSPSALGDGLTALPISSKFSERALENLLIDGEANDAAGIALSAMLFYQAILRYPNAVPTSFKNWYQQHVKDPYADIALPGIIDMLHGEFGVAWIDRSNREILDKVIWRFVIRQHQTMSYERGFGGGAPLFHVDGVAVIGTNVDYVDPRALNARLRSALQILTDLGFITWDDDEGYCRSDEGDALLKAELLEEQRR